MPTALPRVEANMKRRRNEQAVQKAVFDHLRIRAATGTFAFPANGGARSPIAGAILKGIGVVAGNPDVLAIKDGKIYGLELKSPGGKILPAQHERPPELSDIQRYIRE
jgi:hypothetical protein